MARITILKWGAAPRSEFNSKSVDGEKSRTVGELRDAFLIDVRGLVCTCDSHDPVRQTEKRVIVKAMANELDPNR